MGLFNHDRISPQKLDKNGVEKSGYHRLKPQDSGELRIGKLEPEGDQASKHFPVERTAHSLVDHSNDKETLRNTIRNADLYHLNDESVDKYKTSNLSSDLMGRLYYDDYDSSSPSVSSSPQTPEPRPPTLSYFQLRLGVSSASSPNISPRTSRPILPRHKSLTVVPTEFSPQVSFESSWKHHKSMTIKRKHPEYKFRRNNKSFLVGFNNDPESMRAIDWLFKYMIVHGDTMIVHVVHDEKDQPEIDKLEAAKLMKKIESFNLRHKKIAIVLEIITGKPEKLLKKAIEEYKPEMMVIGMNSRDEESRKISHRLISGPSLPRYFLEWALVPVVVVKPDYQYEELLKSPITSNTYFKDLLAEMNMSNPHEKKKREQPRLSREPSVDDVRGRKADPKSDSDEFLFNLKSRSRSSSRNRLKLF